ncbi:MAG: ATP-dependent acyl-CoA ligase, partial [Deltaproteobacteria bacterium]|nr:ATP-dependent acyl-CoA ligase [Deltaproteobacteria bacterium]
DVKPDIKSIFETCRKGLEGNSVPSYIQVVDEIPKTISEKNLTRILSDAFTIEDSGVHSFSDYR